MCSLKAGNGTRTRVGSLEGYCTSSVLCPRIWWSASLFGRQSNSFDELRRTFLPISSKPYHSLLIKGRRRMGRVGFGPTERKRNRFQGPSGYPEAWTISLP